jgi:putative flippase GtrA
MSQPMHDIPEVTVDSVDEVLPLSRTASLMRFAKRVSGAQFVRYIVVGVWNTALNYGLYAWFTYIFTKHTVHGYLYAYILSNIIGITVAFFGYKIFVFKTKGNWLKEFGRCFFVYGSAIIPGFIALPLLKNLIAHLTLYSVVGINGHLIDLHKLAPYIAQAIITAFTVIYSFFGHRKFSFKATPSQQN